ncbi:MAG: hypothetical protein R2791_00020 [Saprospiraceae bacterium]
MKKALFSILLGLLMVQAGVAQKELTILFAYTNQAACAAGGPAEIKKNVDYGLGLLNTALSNSNVGYRVVAISEYVEVEDGFASTDDEVGELLKELKKPDGKYNKVHQFRQSKKADIVCLVYAGYAMGKAECPGEFMVCHYGVFGDSYIFPHEFGHNLGATHEAAMGGSSGAYPMASIKGQKYRSVSGNGGPSIPYYSDDRTITYEGQSVRIGDASHNNVATMRTNAQRISQAGEALTAVSAVSNAASAKLVNPSSAPMPQGCQSSYTIEKCYITGSDLMIEYKAKDLVRFKFQMYGEDGQPAPFSGGYDPTLKPNETSYKLSFGPPAFSPKEKIVLTINESKEMTCPVGAYTGAPVTSGGAPATTSSVPTKPKPKATKPVTTYQGKPTKPAKPTEPAKTTAPSTTPSETGALTAGKGLKETEKLYSPDKSHYLVMQSDGNLCIYTSSDRFVWCNMVTKGSGCRLDMQSDGNLVVYDRNGQACWSTETHPYFDSKFRSSEWKPVRCALENDGTLCLYSATNKKVWSSKAGKLTDESAGGSYSLEYVSGAGQDYGGGGMPKPMVLKIKDKASGSYVTDLRGNGLTFEVTANTDGQYDGQFNNLNNYCKNGDKACYGGYYYVPSNRGKSPYTLKVTVTLKKDGKAVDSYVVEENIGG